MTLATISVLNYCVKTFTQFIISAGGWTLLQPLQNAWKPHSIWKEGNIYLGSGKHHYVCRKSVVNLTQKWLHHPCIHSASNQWTTHFFQCVPQQNWSILLLPGKPLCRPWKTLSRIPAGYAKKSSYLSHLSGRVLEFKKVLRLLRVNLHQRQKMSWKWVLAEKSRSRKPSTIGKMDLKEKL